MPQVLTVGVAQVHTLDSLTLTLSALRSKTEEAAARGVSILLFPEAYLGGYPRTCSFGASVGSRTDDGREQFLQYFKSAVDLGDTPSGGGDDWIQRTLPVNKESGRRGDGTREFLEDVARDTGVFVVTGVVEKAGGSLYCAAVYVDPKRGILGKRRKVMPTGSERLVWAQGQPNTLKAVNTTIRGVKVVMGCAICWENYMPLLRYSIYSQNVNLWLAPTADPRDTWEALMRTIASEGRCFVVSGNQCIKSKNLPEWIKNGKGQNPSKAPAINGEAEDLSLGRRRSMTAKTDENHEITWKSRHDIPEDRPVALRSSSSDDTNEDFASRGGSCIVNPMGRTLVGPLWDKEEELLVMEIDFDDCERGRLDFDATGHYARPDAFKLTVEGLDINPPP